MSQERFSTSVVETFECVRPGFSVDNGMLFDDEDSDIFDEDETFFCNDYDDSSDVTFAPSQSFHEVASYNLELKAEPGHRLEDIFMRMDDLKEKGADQISGPLTSDIATDSDDRRTDNCSLSDLLDGDYANGSATAEENVDFENKNKLMNNGRNDFGVNRFFLTGDIAQNSGFQNLKGGFVAVSTNRAPYVHKLHGLRAATLQNIHDELFNAPTKFNCGTFYEAKSGPSFWTILWGPEQLHGLTTFTMMSTICAALNSQRRLQWIIGVGRDGKILGCTVSNEERDTLRQAFIYCVRSGILPELHPELVHLRFIPVQDQFFDESNMRLLVEITIEHKVSTLYQLSSGQIFYVSRNQVAEVEGGIDEARRLLEVNYKSDLRPVLDQAPYGYLRYGPSLYSYERDGCSAIVWLMRKVVAIFVPGVALGFSARYFLRKYSLLL